MAAVQNDHKKLNELTDFYIGPYAQGNYPEKQLSVEDSRLI